MPRNVILFINKILFVEKQIPIHRRNDFFKELDKVNFSRSIILSFFSVLINSILLITDWISYYVENHDFNSKLMFFSHLAITLFSLAYYIFTLFFRKKINNQRIPSFIFLAVLNILALIITAAVQLIHTNIAVYFIIMIVVSSAYYMRPFVSIIFMSANYFSIFYIITEFVQENVMKAPLLSDSAIITIAAFTASVTNFGMIAKQFIYRLNLEKETYLKEYEKNENAAKSDFIAKISHEIRTPVNAISGTIELLEHSDLKDYQKNYLKIAKTSMNNLLSLVNNVLDISKIEAGAMEIDEKCFYISEEIANAVETMKKNACDKGTEINLFIDETIPDCLKGDRLKIMQIFNNLLSNAVKFTEKGEIIITISEQEKKEEFIFILFEIADSGIGIPENETYRLFNKFSQIKGFENRNHKGSGLGLMISKELTELMNGKIGYRKNIPQGSVFFFVLPLQYKKKN